MPRWAEPALQDAAEADFGWPQAVVSGLLWGAVLSVLSVGNEIAAGDSLVAVADFWLTIAGGWGVLGICWSLIAMVWARRMSRLALVAVWLVAAPALAAAQALYLVTPNPFWFGQGVRGLLQRDIAADAIFARVLWSNAVYGGLYLVGFIASQNLLRDRRRRLLIQLAVDEARAGSDEAGLQAMRGQIQPELLMRALAGLGLSYATRPDVADRISSLLVGFLRQTMPGLRRPGSTLATEIEVVLAYVALQAALDPQGPTWRVNLEGPAPDQALPALVLLPIVDELGRAAAPGDRLEISVRQDPTAFRLIVHAEAAAPITLSAALRARMDHGVAGGWGGALAPAIETGPDGRTFTFTLLSPSTPGVFPGAPLNPHDHGATDAAIS